MFSKRNLLSLFAIASLTSLVIACGGTETVEVEVVKEVVVEKEVVRS
jgi:hypothetical protein